jgi:DNA replication protein DnaD
LRIIVLLISKSFYFINAIIGIQIIMHNKKKKDEAVAEPSTMTTIAISRTNQNILNSMRRGFEDYNAIVTRLLAGQTETWTEIIAIDNELPYSHTCILQLGEKAEKLHYWNGQDFREITFEEATKTMKQPKPNITLTKDELYFLLSHDIIPVRQKIFHINPNWADAKIPPNLEKRLSDFVENQPSDNAKRDS